MEVVLHEVSRETDAVFLSRTTAKLRLIHDSGCLPRPPGKTFTFACLSGKNNNLRSLSGLKRNITNDLTIRINFLINIVTVSNILSCAQGHQPKNSDEPTILSRKIFGQNAKHSQEIHHIISCQTTNEIS